MRPGDVDGKDYYFIDRKKFEDGINCGKFAEWAEVHGHFYGTPTESLDSYLEMQKDVLLDLDVVGGLNLKKMYGERALSIFLVPPSMEELERRLLGRGTDSPEVQRLRLKNAIIEMGHKDKFDHMVVNDVLDRACAEIERIIGR